MRQGERRMHKERRSQISHTRAPLQARCLAQAGDSPLPACPTFHTR
jgi:hypothetical protein